jgi:hypothetical protein
MKPWIVESRCIPPHADAEFVWRMEDVIQTYMLSYDPRYPVVCFDEACKQLFGEVRPARLPRLGRRPQVDYESERNGICHRLLRCEPLRGGRRAVRLYNEERLRQSLDYSTPGEVYRAGVSEAIHGEGP